MALDIDNLAGDRADAWVPFQDGSGVSLLLTYSESKAPRDYYMRALGKLRRRSTSGIPDQKKVEALVVDLLVNYVVKDWKGLTQKDPTNPKRQIPFDYSKENCRKLLSASPLIRDFISANAQDIENFGGSLSEADAEEVGSEADAGKSITAVAA